jgi:hypothetical protein
MKNETEIQKRARELGKEPAFPTSSLETAFGYTGLTKREWFMGMALQGLSGKGFDGVRGNDIVSESIWLADALLIALAESEVTNG